MKFTQHRPDCHIILEFSRMAFNTLVLGPGKIYQAQVKRRSFHAPNLIGGLST